MKQLIQIEAVGKKLREMMSFLQTEAGSCCRNCWSAGGSMSARAELTSPAKAEKHPRAGQEMTGADMIVQVIADQGVDIVFGYSGGAILPTYDAVFRHNADQDPAKGEADRIDRSGKRTGRRLHGSRICPL